MLKHFTVTESVPSNEVVVTIYDQHPTLGCPRSTMAVVRTPTQLGKLVQSVVARGAQFRLMNGVDLSWVQQVRANINSGYVY